MRICCPHCGYVREVSDEQVPEGLSSVTCPKCKERFQFVKPEEVQAEQKVHYTFNPWNLTPNNLGYIPAFCLTCLRVMMAPRRFFSDIESVPIKRALKFYVILAVIQIVMEKLWGRVVLSYLQSSTLGDQQLEQTVSLLAAAAQGDFWMLLGLQFLLALFQIYLMAFILTLSWRIITRGKEDFYVIFQVLAYAEAPCILCIVPVIGGFLGFGLSLVLAVFGCKEALRLDWHQTVLGFVPVALLVTPTILQMASIFSF